jgi:hypothetical protein
MARRVVARCSCVARSLDPDAIRVKRPTKRWVQAPRSAVSAVLLSRDILAGIAVRERRSRLRCTADGIAATRSRVISGRHSMRSRAARLSRADSGLQTSASQSVASWCSRRRALFHSGPSIWSRRRPAHGSQPSARCVACGPGSAVATSRSERSGGAAMTAKSEQHPCRRSAGL